jgi:hypothetical protein
MANSPHLFENLQLMQGGEVAGIISGLEIKGIGTFKFKVNDDNRKTHKIKIPNSLYLPDLKRCLVSPQHWAQEAGDNYPLPRGTWMENDDKQCVLVGGQGKYKKSIPFNATSNVPIMHSALSSLAYPAYATTFEALKAPSSAASMSSSSQVFADATTLPNKNSLPRKISITKKESQPLRQQ